MQTLQLVDPYVGKYFSIGWVRKNVLNQTEEDIKEIEKQMKEEAPQMQADGPTDVGQ